MSVQLQDCFAIESEIACNMKTLAPEQAACYHPPITGTHLIFSVPALALGPLSPVGSRAWLMSGTQKQGDAGSRRCPNGYHQPSWLNAVTYY
jgi:hypothetical protein